MNQTAIYFIIGLIGIGFIAMGLFFNWLWFGRHGKSVWDVIRWKIK